jgi:hypothetical protein
MKGKVFEAPLLGRKAECVSADDALDVRAADLILSEQNPDGTKPEELERLAAVLMKYRRDRAAEKLNERAQRRRATQFLVEALDKGDRSAH